MTSDRVSDERVEEIRKLLFNNDVGARPVTLSTKRERELTQGIADLLSALSQREADRVDAERLCDVCDRVLNYIANDGLRDALRLCVSTVRKED